MGKVISRSITSGGVIVFVKRRAGLAAKVAPAVDAAKRDLLSWIAYPKGGQQQTDLNRDILREQLLRLGVEGVRLVALDDVWSAMRFRPVKRHSATVMK